MFLTSSWYVKKKRCLLDINSIGYLKFVIFFDAILQLSLIWFWAVYNLWSLKICSSYNFENKNTHTYTHNYTIFIVKKVYTLHSVKKYINYTLRAIDSSKLLCSCFNFLYTRIYIQFLYLGTQSISESFSELYLWDTYDSLLNFVATKATNVRLYLSIAEELLKYRFCTYNIDGMLRQCRYHALRDGCVWNITFITL